MKKIYTLQLLNNKYYIGIISNLDRQIGEYFDGYGSQWIKLNNPIKINNLECNPIFEDDKYNSFIKININNIQKISFKGVLYSKKN